MGIEPPPSPSLVPDRILPSFSLSNDVSSRCKKGPLPADQLKVTLDGYTCPWSRRVTELFCWRVTGFPRHAIRSRSLGFLFFCWWREFFFLRKTSRFTRCGTGRAAGAAWPWTFKVKGQRGRGHRDEPPCRSGAGFYRVFLYRVLFFFGRRRRRGNGAANVPTSSRASSIGWLNYRPMAIDIGQVERLMDVRPTNRSRPFAPSARSSCRLSVTEFCYRVFSCCFGETWTFLRSSSRFFVVFVFFFVRVLVKSNVLHPVWFVVLFLDGAQRRKPGKSR